jgi:hypothetical protein
LQAVHWPFTHDCVPLPHAELHEIGVTPLSMLPSQSLSFPSHVSGSGPGW